MIEENALAAGQGGTETVLAPLTQDEVHRQSAVEELAGYLAKSRGMLARCESLSNTTRGDRLGAIHAAARLMNANAQVAKALAHVALVESRRRVVVETIQRPNLKMAELNSRFSPPRNYDDARAELKRRLDAMLAEDEREQEEMDDFNIGCCI